MAKETRATVEGMTRQRRIILVGTLIFGGLWQATRIVDDLTRDGKLLPLPWSALLVAVQLVGWLGWTVSLFRMASFGKRLRANPVLAEAVGDEFYQQVRLKSFAAALLSTLVCQGGLILASLFYPLGARAGADLTIFIACTTAFSAFLWLERE